MLTTQWPNPRPGADSVADIESEVESQIYDGQDVMTYYATYGHEAPIHLFHCNRAFAPGAGSPYEMLVCSKEGIKPEYFVVTAAGVAHISADGTSEFVPLGEWLREQSIYNLLRQDGKTYLLEEFQKEQLDAHRTCVQPTLDGLAASMITVLRKLIKDVTAQEASLRGEVAGFQADPSAGASRGLSSHKIRQERADKTKLLACLTRERASLPAVIRLADSMMVECGVSLLADSLACLQAALETRPRLLVEAQLTPEDIAFSPTDQGILKALNGSVFESMVGVIKRMPRILAAEEFQALFQGMAQPGADLVAMITASDMINQTRLRCNQLIMRSFQKAQAHADQLQGLRAVAQFTRSFQAAGYGPDMCDIGQFRQDMLLLRQWQAQVESMGVGQAAGAVHVDCAGTQRTLLTGLTTAMLALQDRLSDTVQRHSEDAMAVFKDLIKHLKERPFRLDEFAIWYGQMPRIKELETGALENWEQVQRMWDMLLGYGGRIISDHQEKVDDLKEDVLAFHKARMESSSFADERLAGMVSTLERNIKELFTELQEVSTELRSGVYDQAEGTPSVSQLDSLYNLTTTFENISDRAKRYTAHAAAFQINPTDFSELEAVGRELASVQSQWNALQTTFVD
ncbi:hypothetical protein WJX72_002479 [[Myrmecia] bisecta]|uniref:Uncharacterized protein n=1 Tax=[Myrmecia] bisecta TaxID=41462 RepID=A0AAW1PJD7_9CHLO